MMAKQLQFGHNYFLCLTSFCYLFGYLQGQGLVVISKRNTILKSDNKIQKKNIFLDVRLWVSWKQLNAWQFLLWGLIFVSMVTQWLLLLIDESKKIVRSITLIQFLICFKYLIFTVFVFTLSGSWVLIVVFFASQVECKFKAPSIYCSTTAIQEVKKITRCTCFFSFVHVYVFLIWCTVTVNVTYYFA